MSNEKDPEGIIRVPASELEPTNINVIEDSKDFNLLFEKYEKLVGDHGLEELEDTCRRVCSFIYFFEKKGDIPTDTAIKWAAFAKAKLANMKNPS